MNHQRPVNLDLSSLKFPPMAIVSILHRISGVVLFLLLPLILYYFRESCVSHDTFDDLHILLQNPFHKLLLWGFSAAFFFHVLAGIRHMFMDAGFGEHLASARRSAIILMSLAILLTIFLGFLIW